MNEVCAALWQTDVWEWDLGYAWRSAGWLVRFDVYGLGLMLTVTFIIFCRASWLYYSVAGKS